MCYNMSNALILLTKQFMLLSRACRKGRYIHSPSSPYRRCNYR